MAQPFQQQALNRKLIYALCIAALFTGSLIHRKFVIIEQAKELLLREVDRGEVELTGSAVRLVLTGSRGLAVTILWNDVLKKQERHKWNEVELLVNSITELQPYFITPWLFQSWNLAFNVAVECDRPRDKYYYVTRGLERLAAGERRNAVPGNPDLRHSMGVYIKMKIGTSDEKMTMRSLLDLSTIDPVDRDPDKLWSRGREIKPKEFAKFCEDNPRLVRRLHDKLGYNDKDVVGFLAENHRDLPNRFSDKKTYAGKSVLREAIDQWPILPPKAKERRWKDWPDAKEADFGLTKESFDVFMVSRTWHAYAQDNLPPADAESGMFDIARFDKTVHRIPRRPTLIIFRGDPARMQAYMAETLQEEGWFDEHGWFLKDWFPDDKQGAGLLIGEGKKYDSGIAWGRSYERYKEYGRENGMYLEPDEYEEVKKQAEEFRKRFGLNPGDRAPLPANVRDPKLIAAFRANERLHNAAMHRSLTNFDGLFYESQAQSTPQAVAALKLFHMANEFRTQAPPVTMVFYELNEQTNQYEEKAAPLLQVYNRAIELWLGVLLRHPSARRIQTLQEDTYEAQWKFIRYFQSEKMDRVLRPLMRALAGGIEAEHGEDQDKKPFVRAVRRSLPMVLPVPGGVDVGHPHELYEAVGGKWTRLRDFRGPFDMTSSISWLDERQEQELKTFLVYWASGGNQYLTFHPHLRDFQLSLTTPREQQFVGWWTPVISPGAVNVVRNRYRGLQAPIPEQPPAGPEQPPAGPQQNPQP